MQREWEHAGFLERIWVRLLGLDVRLLLWVIRAKRLKLHTVSNYGFHMEGSRTRTIMAYPRPSAYRGIENIARFSSRDRSYDGVPLGDSRNDNRGQIIRARFLISMFGEKTGNCHHHASSCERKCSKDCCDMYRSERNADLSEKTCKYCHNNVFPPWALHYVSNPENPVEETCYEVLRKREYLSCHQCRGKINPYYYMDHYEDARRAKGCLSLKKKLPWKRARKFTNKIWKRVCGRMRAFGKQIERASRKLYNNLRRFFQS